MDWIPGWDGKGEKVLELRKELGQCWWWAIIAECSASFTEQTLSSCSYGTAKFNISSGYKIKSEKTNTVFSILSNIHKNNQSGFTFRATQDRIGFQQQDRLCPKKYIFLQEGKDSQALALYNGRSFHVWV